MMSESWEDRDGANVSCTCGHDYGYDVRFALLLLPIVYPLLRLAWGEWGCLCVSMKFSV